MAENVSGFGIPSGAWVSGTSMNDERIRGFVRHYDALTSLYTVTVVQSDRKETIGRTVFAKEGQIAELAETGSKDAEALRDLVDLALSVRDEVWFYELTAELIALEATSKRRSLATPL
ncbi:IDEAL domain-containing protein [Paenibacillus sp. TRM 82003]|nr:IDEAL domain-containing protein [Paenibacillus sp. TRM 82003]